MERVPSCTTVGRTGNATTEASALNKPRLQNHREVARPRGHDAHKAKDARGTDRRTDGRKDGQTGGLTDKGRYNGIGRGGKVCREMDG